MGGSGQDGGAGDETRILDARFWAERAWELRFQEPLHAESLAEESLAHLDALRESPGGISRERSRPEILHIRARALSALGRVQADLGKHESALSRLLEAMAIYEALEDMEGLIQSRNSLGRVLFYLSDYEEAERFYLLAEESAEALGDEVSAARAIVNRGLCLSEEGRLPEAFEELERGLGRSAEARDEIGSAVALEGLASAELARGDAVKALSYARSAVGRSEAVGLVFNLDHSFCTLADALAGLGRAEDALAAAARAAAIARDRGSARGEAEAERRKGDMLRRLGRSAEAVEVLGRACESAVSLGVLRLRLEAEFSYAIALKEAGRSAESFSHFQLFSRIRDEAEAFKTAIRKRVQACIDSVPEYARRKA